MSVDARHSPFYAWLNYAAIRELIYSALDLSTGERLMLIKGLVPDLVDDIGEASFESFLDEVRVKARRYAEAVAHPGGGGVCGTSRRTRAARDRRASWPSSSRRHATFERIRDFLEQNDYDRCVHVSTSDIDFNDYAVY